MSRRKGASRRVRGAAPATVGRWHPPSGPMRVLAWVAIFMALAYGGAWLVDPWSFPIDTVALEGDLDRTDVAGLRAAVMPFTAAGFFGVDVAAVRDAALAGPWVDEVSVIRRWPSTLVVQVTERRAAARWGSAALLDENGRVFYPPGGAGAGLPLLAGPPGSSAELFTLHHQLQAAALGQLPAIAALRLDRRGVVRLQYAQGPLVTMRLDRVTDQWQRFFELWQALDAARREQLLSADLRYAAGMAVRWQAQPEGPDGSVVAGVAP